MRIVRVSLVLVATLLVAAVGISQAQQTGSISGVVTDANGSPIAGRWIYVYPSSFDYAYAVAVTDASGIFVATSLPADTYYLSTDTSEQYVPQFYGTTCPIWRCTFRDGTPVPLAAGQSVTGINFTLRTGGSVAGQLFDAATGVPVPTDARLLTLSPLDRLELSLKGAEAGECAPSWSGYHVVAGETRTLPAGSALDPAGTFYWQPGAAFGGTYELVFVRTACDGVRSRVPVRVNIRSADGR